MKVSQRNSRQDLSDAAVRLLVAFAAGQVHGYAAMREAGLTAGTAYPLIDRLRKVHMIQRIKVAAVERVDERRRYYRLTPAGADALRAEIERMAALIATANARLSQWPSEKQ